VERVSEATGAGGRDGFAALLRELKDRSGLSYGALAKRLHMSTSTLHRYCNGTALPNEYAPAERLARVCRATPQELMELHRRWILADAARRGRGEQGAVAGSSGAGEAAGAARGDGSSEAADTGSTADAAERSNTASTPGPDPASPSTPEPTPTSASTSASGSAPTPASVSVSAPAVTSDSAAAPDGASSPGRDSADGEGGEDGETAGDGGEDGEGGGEVGGGGEPVAIDAPGEPTPSVPRGRRRSALIAAAAVTAVLGAVALAVSVPFGGGGNGAANQREAGAAATTGGPEPSGVRSAPRSPGAKTHGPSGSAPASADESGKSRPGASQGGDGRGVAGADKGGGAAPLNVAIRPYVYESPCSQHFLVDSGPEQVGPPANEQDAPRWAAAYGAVSSGEQRVALTVQGTGRETVVLEALHVRVVAKGAPLAWNDYAMGVGCGGGVGTKSFDIDLDKGSPRAAVKNGQRDFPYKVSESDPEVFYVTAHTKAHDVRWDLSLEWSSGSRRGTVHLDSAGTPFRTSGGAGRPGYDYPLGGGEWVEREG
jgi:plasmid maintenance system antidote protein VapI